MEEIKVTGVILKTVDHKENDKLAYILTPDKGKITAVFKGVKKQGAKMRSFAQPLTFAEFLLVRRSGFFTVTSCSLVDNFYSLAYDADKFFAACLALEAGDIMSQENQPDGVLITVILRALKELTYSESKARVIAVKFLLLAMEAGGYKLSFGNCGGCNVPAGERFYIDAAQGGAVCALCRSLEARPIRLTTLNCLRFIDDTDTERLNTLKISDEESVAALRAAAWAYECAVGTPLKSVKNLY